MAYTPTSPLLCTIDEVLTALAINDVEFNTDPLLLAIDAACRKIENHCARRFWQDPVPRVDPECILNGTATVADASITLADAGRSVSAANELIQAGSIVTYPVEGVGFTLANFEGTELPALGSATESLTIGLTPRRFVSNDPWLVECDDISTPQNLVIESDYAGDGSFGTVWAASDYQTEPVNGIMEGLAGWPIVKIRAIRSLYFPVWGGISYPKPYTQALVQITARWGWATVPAAVHEAAIIQSIATYKATDVPFGATPFGEMGVLRMRQALHPSAELLLEPYAEDEVLVA